MKHPLSWLVIVVIVLGGVLECGVARADWSIAGAQSSCHSDHHVFEISPYSTYSGLRDTEEHTPLKSGFRRVVSESPISCELAGQMLRAVVRIIEPYEGNGMGAGRVDVLSMKLGGLNLLYTTEYLDWGVTPWPENLISIRVTAAKRSVSIERCYGHISLAETEVGKEIIDHCDTNQITRDLPTNDGGDVNCQKERLSNVETNICADSALSQSASQLGSIYAVAKATHEGHAKAALLRSQRAWLKARNRCSSIQCLQAAYDARIVELASTPNVQSP